MTTYTVGTGVGFDYPAITGAGGVNSATFSSGDYVLFNRGESFSGQLRCSDAGVTYGATLGDGPLPIITGYSAVSPVDVTAASTLQDLNVTDPGGSSARCIGISLASGDVALKRCVIDGNRAGRGIRLLTGGDLVIEDCVIQETGDGMYLDGTSVSIKNTIVKGGNHTGILTLPTSTCSTTLLNTHVSGYTGTGVAFGGSGTHVAKLSSSNGNQLDGWSANDSTVVTLLGCTANSNGGVVTDSGDGFTAHGTAVIKLYGCQGSKNFKSGIKVVQDSSGEIINNSFYDNYDDTYANDNYGISIDVTSGNWVIKNNVTQGHRREIQVTSTAVAGTGVFDIGDNIYNNTREELAYEWNGNAMSLASFNTSAGDTTSIQADPLFEDAESLLLSVAEGSPCIGAGVRWWGTAANPVGANGEPFSDIDTDIGGIQSTHGPFHPRNL